jgi:leader peptidase (prepilin peptidase)/N-methyltransferase
MGILFYLASLVLMPLLAPFSFELKLVEIIKQPLFRRTIVLFMISASAIMLVSPMYQYAILWLGILFILAAVDFRHQSVRVNDLILLSIALIPAVIYQNRAVPINSLATILIGQFMIVFFVASGLIALKYLLKLFYKQNALGGADIWVILTILIALGGTAAIIAIYSGILFSACYGLVAVGVFKQSRKTQVPFIPFLLCGVLTSVFFSDIIWKWYQYIINAM